MLKTGSKVSFYHEGGVGDRRWVIGWRCGVIRATPSKGSKKNYVQIELHVRSFSWDEANKKWLPRPPQRVWVHLDAVNELGDYTNHGPRLAEVVRERKDLKKKQQAKADKKARRPKKAA